MCSKHGKILFHSVTDHDRLQSKAHIIKFYFGNANTIFNCETINVDKFSFLLEPILRKTVNISDYCGCSFLNLLSKFSPSHFAAFAEFYKQSIKK